MSRRDGWTRLARSARRTPGASQGKLTSLGGTCMWLAWSRSPSQETSSLGSSQAEERSGHRLFLLVHHQRLFIQDVFFIGIKRKLFPHGSCSDRSKCSLVMYTIEWGILKFRWRCCSLICSIRNPNSAESDLYLVRFGGLWLWPLRSPNRCSSFEYSVVR